MTMNTLFCPYCMKPVIGSEGTVESGCCSTCGRDPAAYVPSSHHLSPGTLLRDRYLLGCVLGEGGSKNIFRLNYVRGIRLAEIP